MDQISGPGFRKAIEFLIKDYLIYKTPDSKDKVESSFLKTCIDLLPDSNLKETALRGTWIGNDTIHYIKKWIDKDISDLKTAIDLIIHWISYEHATEKMIKDMP